jgi:hypothetical protein
MPRMELGLRNKTRDHSFTDALAVVILRDTKNGLPWILTYGYGLWEVPCKRTGCGLAAKRGEQRPLE